jgi:aminoglycoside phosphotransferase (APT) family kinase protein
MSAAASIIDTAKGVRPGEELPVEALDAWLKPRIAGLTGTPTVTQFSGGASNWTYRLAYPSHDLILRRPPHGTKAKSAHDMGREFRIQRALAPSFPIVPEMLAFCDDESVIGAEFYVMRRIEGVILRANPPRGMTLDARTARRLSEAAVDTLVKLHTLDVDAAGLRSFDKGPGYTKRQIEGWSERYKKARTWNVPSAERVMAWLRDNVPDDAGRCLIHNDFRLDNLVLDAADPTRIIGMLDWEMATVGDPFMDVGNSLAYWVEAGDDPIARSLLRRQPTHLPGMLTRREFMERYAAGVGKQPHNWAFYEVYGLFRLAVIIQQIYYRYHHKQTQNPAFKNFWLMSQYLNLRSLYLITRSRF